MPAVMTVQDLLELPLAYARFLATEGEEVKHEGRVNLIEVRDGELWITFGPNGNGHLHVCFLISECSIERLVGGEVLIQEGECRATIYPA